MLRITFSEEQINELHFQRFNHPHPRVQLKMEVLYLKSQGFSANRISRLAKVSEKTVGTYAKEYEKGGIEALKVIKFRRQQSELTSYSQIIREHLTESPVASLKQAREEIYQLTGLKRSPERLSKFLQKLGLRRMKVGAIPAKADAERQAEFLKNELNPRLEEAKKGEREVFF